MTTLNKDLWIYVDERTGEPFAKKIYLSTKLPDRNAAISAKSKHNGEQKIRLRKCKLILGDYEDVI